MDWFIAILPIIVMCTSVKTDLCKSCGWFKEWLSDPYSLARAVPASIPILVNILTSVFLQITNICFAINLFSWKKMVTNFGYHRGLLDTKCRVANSGIGHSGTRSSSTLHSPCTPIMEGVWNMSRQGLGHSPSHQCILTHLNANQSILEVAFGLMAISDSFYLPAAARWLIFAFPGQK